MDNIYSLPKINFHFDLNLQNLSAVALATSLWKIPTMKKLIFDDNNNIGIKEIERFRYKSWYKVTKPIWDYLKLIPGALPNSLQAMLNDEIVNIGENILNWIEYVTITLKLDISFAKEIYFTHYGTVDVKRIFSLYWARNFKFNQVTYGDNYKIFLLSCIIAQVDFIEKYKDEMIKYDFCNSARKHFDISNDKVHVIMTVWLYHHIAKEMIYKLPMHMRYILYEKLKLDWFDYNSDKMFNLCVAVGFSEAAKYYLNLIYASNARGVSHVNAVLGHAAEICFGKCCQKTNQITLFQKDKYIEILLNVLNNFPNQERFSFILKQGVEFLFLLLVHPYHRFYLFTFECILMSLSNDNFTTLIKTITHSIVTDSTNFCPIKKYMHKLLLLMTWSRMSDSSKEFALKNSTILSSLFKIKDYSCLGALLNIRYLPKSIEFTELDLYGSIQRSVKLGFFQCLDSFLKKTFNSDDREIFKLQIISIFDALFEENNFTKADKVLDWLASSGTNPRYFYKCKIEPKHIIQKFLSSGRGDLVQKFLLWRFTSEEERNKIKADMGIYEYETTIIYEEQN